MLTRDEFIARVEGISTRSGVSFANIKKFDFSIATKIKAIAKNKGQTFGHAVYHYCYGGPVLCKNCKKPTRFRGFTNGYNEYCSKTCSNIDLADVRANSARKNCLEKHGVNWHTNKPEVRRKIEQSCLKKFGTKRPLQSAKIRAQCKKTLIRRWGVENSWHIPEHKKSRSSTNLTREEFTKCVLSSKVVRWPEASNIDVYWADKIQNHSVKHNIRFAESLYIFCYGHHKGCLACERPTNFISFSDGYCNHCCKKCMDNNPSIVTKREVTSLSRYGTRNPMQNSTIQLKASRNSYLSKKVFIGGRYFDLQGYEPQYLLETVKTIDLDRIYPGSDLPKFWYTINGIRRSYTPDFLLLSEGTKTDEIVEVKSFWTLGVNRHEVWKEIVLKGRSVEREGFKFRLALTDCKGKITYIPNFTSKTRLELRNFLESKGITK